MTRSQFQRSGTLAGAVLCAALAACTSTGSSDKASSAVDSSIQTSNSASELATGLSQLGTGFRGVDTALTNLRESVGTEGWFNRQKVAKEDSNVVFAGYQTALDNVQATHARVDATHADLTRAMEAHLANWNENLAEMQTGTVREASMKRRDEARTNYEEAREAYQDAWQRCTEHIGELEEIEIALGSDLTPEGIDALDKAMSKALSENAVIEKELAKASAVLEQFAQQLRIQRAQG